MIRELCWNQKRACDVETGHEHHGYAVATIINGQHRVFEACRRCGQSFGQRKRADHPNWQAYEAYERFKYDARCRCLICQGQDARQAALAAERAKWQQRGQELVASRNKHINDADWEAYLRSDAWSARRNECLARAGHSCVLCGSIFAQLNAHHRTYARVGREEPGDLTCLCRDCHEHFHFGWSPA